LDILEEAALISLWSMAGIFITMMLIGAMTALLVKLFSAR